MKSYDFFIKKVQNQLIENSKFTGLSLYSDCICPKGAQENMVWSDFFLEVYQNTNQKHHMPFRVLATTSIDELKTVIGYFQSGLSLTLAFNQVWPARNGSAEETKEILQSVATRFGVVKSLNEFNAFRKDSANKNLTYVIELSSQKYIVGSIKKSSRKVKFDPFLNKNFKSALVGKKGKAIDLELILKTHPITVFDMTANPYELRTNEVEAS